MAGAKERLDAVQAQLQARGVIDVKLTLAPEVSQQSCEEVADLVATCLEAYLNGNMTRIEKVDIDPAIPKSMPCQQGTENPSR